MPLGRSRQLHPSVEKVWTKEYDRRRPITAPTTFISDAAKPEARKNKGRVIFVRQADGTVRGQYSDGAAWQTFLATSVSFTVPTITYGTTAADGVLSTTIRSDARLKYPSALMSPANSATLTFADDGVNTSLTGSLGFLQIDPGPTGYVLINTATLGAPQMLQVTSNLNGSGDGIKVTLGTPGGARTSETYRGFNFSAAMAANITSCIHSSADIQFNLTPAAGSGSGNTLYQLRLTGGLINNANASFSEVVALDISGARRLVSAPTVTTAQSIRLECPTVSATEQIGIYIKQRTAQVTATTRYGLKIDAQNSGTTKYAVYAPTDQSTFGQVNIDGATVTDATNIVLGTGTGTKIGTGTTQKLGFFNAGPIVQPANTVAINDVLVNLGLRASGGVSNFTTNVDVSTKNIVTDTVTGTKIGTGTTQLLGFWNAAPTTQQTVTGSRGGNAALASLLTALATEGLIVDSSSA